MSNYVVQNLQGAVRETGLRAVRRFYARQAPVALQVTRLVLSFQPDGQDLLITAAYILQCPRGINTYRVAFDFTHMSLALEGFARDVATIDPNRGPGAPKHAFPAVFLNSLATIGPLVRVPYFPPNRPCV